MAADPEVRKQLLKKFGSTPQALYQRANRVRKQQPMSTDDAIYVIAFQNDIKLHKYLDHETLERVGRYVERLGRVAGNGSPAARPRPPNARARATVEVRIGGINVEALPGMTATHAKEAKRMAEKVYPALYVFENSARTVISSVLERGIGPDWWDEVASKPIRDTAARRIADEDKDPWHSKRGLHPIYYTDLIHLVKIVSSAKAWPHLKDVFPSHSWFEGIVNDLNVSRRVIAHMNPLAADDIQHIESSFKKWVKQLRAKEGVLS